LKTIKAEVAVSGRIEISTDGGCIGNPGPGAWAFVIRSGSESLERSGFEPQTTNNRMELTAVRRALEELAVRPEWAGMPVTLTTDSQYVQKGITAWILTWVKNGWKTSAKKPVKNADLWMALWKLSGERAVSWNWVMGHSGDHWNEVCDRLVREEIKRRT
jgi:ribonuclease HI